MEAVCRTKIHQCLCFYHKLQNGNDDSTLIKMFESGFIASVLKLSFVSCYGSLTLQKQKQMHCIVKVCREIAGATLNDLPHVYRFLKVFEEEPVSPG